MKGKRFARKLFSIRKRREGQGMTEYIIIVALIAIVLIAAVSKFGGTLNSIWGKAEDKINKGVLEKVDAVDVGGGNNSGGGSGGGGN